MSLDDESGSAWYGCGVALFRLGRVDEAIEAFERCVAVSPDDVAAWKDLGTCFARKHSIKRAIAAWKKVMELDPQADIVRHLQELESLTASSSDRGEWYGMLGNVELAKRNYAKAATFFDQALAVDPKRSAVWNDRGLCADVLESPIKAIEYFDRALALEPTNAYAWYNKGVSLQRAKRLAAAVDCFEHVVKLHPGDAPPDANLMHAYHNLGSSLIQMGRREDALDSFDEVLKRAREEPGKWTEEAKRALSLKQLLLRPV